MILFRPMRIGPITVSGRLVRSATAEFAADDSGRPGAAVREIYCALARNGTPLVVTGDAFVHANGRSRATQNGIHSDELIPVWRGILESSREAGPETRFFIQLSHGGRQVSPECVTQPIAPSIVPLKSGGVRPREMTRTEVEETLTAFAEAARRAREAGFHGVQLHAAHGFLISQFLSPHTNRRTDEWGGTPERRRRFLLEAVRRVRASIGRNMAVAVKMNAEDFVQDGLSLAEGVEAAKALADAGVDAIEVSAFMPDGNERLAPARVGDPKPHEEGYYLSQALEIKRAVGAVPVGVCGGFRSYDVMHRVLESDGLNFIALSRPFICEPDLLRRFRAGQARATCISCSECLADTKTPIHCPPVVRNRLRLPPVSGLSS